MVCIRENGLYPCHRCLVPKKAIYQLGLPDDMAFRTGVKTVRNFLADQVSKARNLIYRSAKPINGTEVEDLLKETSSVPTQVCLLPNFCKSFIKFSTECFCHKARKYIQPIKNACC